MPYARKPLYVRVRVSPALIAEIKRKCDTLERANKTALKHAADVAERTSRGSFQYKRPLAPKRPGRSSTGGRMLDYVDWKVVGSSVELDVAKLDKRAPHWLIQEIGTGESATMTPHGVSLGQGRPSRENRAKYIRTVKHQAGRQISAGLAFGTGPSGTYTAPGAASGQQLYRRSRLKKSPFKPMRITIRNEIDGQHFVRDGGRAGYREYKRTMLAEARRTFGARKGRP